MDLALMINAYKNVAAFRKINDREWVIIHRIED
jgi:hypothetical protein